MLVQGHQVHAKILCLLINMYFKHSCEANNIVYFMTKILDALIDVLILNEAFMQLNSSLVKPVIYDLLSNSLIYDLLSNSLIFYLLSDALIFVLRVE